MQFVLCFTIENWPPAQKTIGFLSFLVGAKRVPPGRRVWSKALFAAVSLKRASRGGQDALKVPEFANGPYGFLVFGVGIFGIRYSGFCSFRSKTRVSGLKNLAFHICFTMVSAHGHVGLFGQTSEAAFLCLLFAPLPLLCIFDRVMLEPRSCIQNLRKSLRWVTKNEGLLRKLCRTLGPTSSQASGWHAKRPTVQFILCFTIENWPRAQQPYVFIVFGGVAGGPREAPKRPRRCLFAAMPPRGPQEASKRP